MQIMATQFLPTSFSMDQTQTDFPTESDWLKYNAERGITDMQIALASQILISKCEPTTEAYKWFFIALYLGDHSAHELVAFLSRTMTEEQVQKGDELVEAWLESKNEQFLEQKTDGWSQPLLDSCRSVRQYLLN